MFASITENSVLRALTMEIGSESNGDVFAGAASSRSSFIYKNVSNSNKISEYSSSEMESSDNAFEMRLLIVLSAETANIAIFSCFSFFNDIFLIA